MMSESPCLTAAVFCPWAPGGIGSVTAASCVTAQTAVLTDFCILFQLIDLGSPLIQLSPEADKENVDSPLLKF